MLEFFKLNDNIYQKATVCCNLGGTQMKKLLSLLLSVLLIFTITVPAFAAVDSDDTPIVILRGDGVALSKYDENGNEELIYPIETSALSDKITETTVNILIPFLTEGLLFDKWDNYYKVVYEEISPIFEDVILDDDGNPRDNSGITSYYASLNEKDCKYDSATWDGSYKATAYTYYYDWRLDPKDVIDGLHEYIVSVYNATGRKITLAGNCLGGSYVLAYLQKYCMDGSKYIKNVFFNATVANGSSILTDIYCGKINVDAKSLQRFLDQYVDADSSSIGGLFDTLPVINEIILSSVDMLVQLSLIDKLGYTLEQVYDKVYQVLVPMLVMAFYGTMPGYWTVIETGRFEEAKNFVFGSQSSQLRNKYAGVIEKIDRYYDEVSSQKEQIINSCKEAGIYFGATAKYGTQTYPFVESQTQLSDEKVNLTNSSFGATTAKDAYSVLSDSYIENAKNNLTDKYISFDKQVDASTSLFKDTLWVEKNVSHDNWDYDYKLIEAFASTPNMTVWSDSNFPQYVIRLPDTGEIVPMTAENCNITLWDEIPDDTKYEEPNLVTKLVALMRWLTAMLKYLLHLTESQPATLSF